MYPLIPRVDPHLASLLVWALSCFVLSTPATRHNTASLHNKPPHSCMFTKWESSYVWQLLVPSSSLLNQCHNYGIHKIIYCVCTLCSKVALRYICSYLTGVCTVCVCVRYRQCGSHRTQWGHSIGANTRHNWCVCFTLITSEMQSCIQPFDLYQLTIIIMSPN